MNVHREFVRYWHEHPEQRRGQAAFNAVHDVRPDLADHFRGKPQDPFHNDDRTEPFLCGVQGLISRENGTP